MSLFRRHGAPVASVAPGERVLASAVRLDTADVLAGTREALYIGARRIPWEQVRTASWDEESQVLTVTETGPAAPVHTLAVDRSPRLLQLVRERVTASVVLQRAVALPRGSARIVARRAAGGDREVTVHVEYDDLADPDDPAVVALVAAALGSAQDDLGGA